MKTISMLPAAFAALAAAYILIGAWLAHVFGEDRARMTPAAARGIKGAQPLRLALSRAAAVLGAGALALSMTRTYACAAEIAALLTGAVLGGALAYGIMLMSVRHGGATVYEMMQEHGGRGWVWMIGLAGCLCHAMMAGLCAHLASGCVLDAVQRLGGGQIPRAAALAAVLALGLALSLIPEGRARRAGGWLAAGLLAVYAAALFLGMPAAPEETIPWIRRAAGAQELLGAAAFGAYLGLFILPDADAAKIASERHMRPVALGGAVLAAAVCVVTLAASGRGVMASLAASFGCDEGLVRAGCALLVCALSLHALQATLRSIRRAAQVWRAPALPGMRARPDAADAAALISLALGAWFALRGSLLLASAVMIEALGVGILACHLLYLWFRQIGRRRLPILLLGIALFAMAMGVFAAAV